MRSLATYESCGHIMALAHKHSKPQFFPFIGNCPGCRQRYDTLALEADVELAKRWREEACNSSR